MVEDVTEVTPVPPLAIGRATPERLNARVPEVVIGVPLTDRNAGTVAATDVTVPVLALDHVGAAVPPALVSTRPDVPLASRVPAPDVPP